MVALPVAVALPTLVRLQKRTASVVIKKEPKNYSSRAKTQNARKLRCRRQLDMKHESNATFLRDRACGLNGRDKSVPRKGRCGDATLRTAVIICHHTACTLVRSVNKTQSARKICMEHICFRDPTPRPLLKLHQNLAERINKSNHLAILLSQPTDVLWISGRGRFGILHHPFLLHFFDGVVVSPVSL